MPIVVDAYNVVHVTGVLPPELAGMDVPELVRVLPRTRFAGERVTLVCDGLPAGGGPPVRGSGSVRVRYAGGGKSADDLIAAMVERTTAPRSLTVVSSDREVQRAARRRRCPVLSSEDFLRRIADDLHGESLPGLLDAAESGPEAAGPAPPPRRPARPTPPADPVFPAELVREAAAFALPPEPEHDPAHADDDAGARGTEPAPRATPAAERAAAAAPPPPPEPPARRSEPLLPADLLAEALALADEEDRRRAGEAARRRAEAEARAARDAASRAAADRTAAELAAREAAERARREERDRRLAGEASAAIGDADLAALEHLLDRAVPADERPARDDTFGDDVIAEAERLLRELDGGDDGPR